MRPRCGWRRRWSWAWSWPARPRRSSGRGNRRGGQAYRRSSQWRALCRGSRRVGWGGGVGLPTTAALRGEECRLPSPVRRQPSARPGACAASRRKGDLSAGCRSRAGWAGRARRVMPRPGGPAAGRGSAARHPGPAADGLIVMLCASELRGPGAGAQLLEARPDRGAARATAPQSQKSYCRREGCTRKPLKAQSRCGAGPKHGPWGGRGAPQI
jgi:hypothetical protein